VGLSAHRCRSGHPDTRVLGRESEGAAPCFAPSLRKARAPTCTASARGNCEAAAAVAKPSCRSAATSALDDATVAKPSCRSRRDVRSRRRRRRRISPCNARVSARRLQCLVRDLAMGSWDGVAGGRHVMPGGAMRLCWMDWANGSCD